MYSGKGRLAGWRLFWFSITFAVEAFNCLSFPIYRAILFFSGKGKNRLSKFRSIKTAIATHLIFYSAALCIFDLLPIGFIALSFSGWFSLLLGIHLHIWGTYLYLTIIHLIIYYVVYICCLKGSISVNCRDKDLGGGFSYSLRYLPDFDEPYFIRLFYISKKEQVNKELVLADIVGYEFSSPIIGFSNGDLYVQVRGPKPADKENNRNREIIQTLRINLENDELSMLELPKDTPYIKLRPRLT
jgi:hypothetical protein